MSRVSKVLPSKRSVRAYRTIVDNYAERPLPELRPGQKIGSKFLFIGGLLLEKITREQMRIATAQSLEDIRDTIMANSERGPRKRTPYLHTNELVLSRPVADAGLSSTQVELRTLPSNSGQFITFFCPPLPEIAEDMTERDVVDPVFRIEDDNIEVMLNTHREDTFTPFDQLGSEQRMLAYLVATDVAETMVRAEHAGALNIV